MATSFMAQGVMSGLGIIALAGSASDRTLDGMWWSWTTLTVAAKRSRVWGC